MREEGVSVEQDKSSTKVVLTGRAIDDVWKPYGEVRASLFRCLRETGFPVESDGTNVWQDADNPDCLVVRLEEDVPPYAIPFGQAPVDEEDDGLPARWWVSYRNLTEEDTERLQEEGFGEAIQVVFAILSDDEFFDAGGVGRLL